MPTYSINRNAVALLQVAQPLEDLNIRAKKNYAAILKSQFLALDNTACFASMVESRTSSREVPHISDMYDSATFNISEIDSYDSCMAYTEPFSSFGLPP